MKIVSLTSNNFSQIVLKAKRVLAHHGLVVFPSDTVYGLAANALSETAVNKLYQFKERPINQSVSIAVKNLKEAQKYVKTNFSQQKILETLLPGPYTVILDSAHKTVSQLEADDQTLAVRVPDYRFTRELSQALAFPYTATSANIHGKKPHYTVSALINTLSDKKKKLLDLVVDNGQLAFNHPSTIINLASSKIQTLRTGDYDFKLILKTVTDSELQTKKLARALITRFLEYSQSQALVFVLLGDLGTGKTVFAKGAGEMFNINNVVSPTYVMYYEYPLKHRQLSQLHHFDLYRLQSQADLQALAIPKLLKPKNLLLFEWGQKLGPIFSLFENQPMKLLLVKLRELTKNKREFTVFQLK